MKSQTADSSLNEIQLHLLQMFSFTKSSKNLTKLKKVLLKFYQDSTDKEMDEIWEKKKLNHDKMDEILKTHKRTTYK